MHPKGLSSKGPRDHPKGLIVQKTQWLVVQRTSNVSKDQVKEGSIPSQEKFGLPQDWALERPSGSTMDVTGKGTRFRGDKGLKPYTNSKRTMQPHHFLKEQVGYVTNIVTLMIGYKMNGAVEAANKNIKKIVQKMVMHLKSLEIPLGAPTFGWLLGPLDATIKVIDTNQERHEKYGKGY
ncbi:hypothetical protein CR513_26205, partial [Mucuna pruriens]